MRATVDIKSALESFLALPEIEPSLEFYAGRIIQKMSPKLGHSLIQGEMLLGLSGFCRPRKLGRVFPELRCTFGGCSIVPDLSYFRQDRMPSMASLVDRDNVTFAPDLVVEIQSPGQTIGELRRKIRAALLGGVKLGWLIDVAHRKVVVLRRGHKAEVLGAGDVLSGADVLPGYGLAIDELFGCLDPP